jgi:hypothetical protein
MEHRQPLRSYAFCHQLFVCYTFPFGALLNNEYDPSFYPIHHSSFA